jgi:hypothetical protein
MAGRAELANKMLALADDENLPPDAALRVHAVALNNAAEGFYATPQTCRAETLLGCWARARRAWCDYTGDALI